MTIISATELWAGQTSDDELTGAKSYERVFQVISDTATESPLVVKAVLPAQGDPYPFDFTAKVKSRSVSRRSDTREVWEATVTYEFEPEDPEDPETDPTAEPAEIDWDSSLEVEIAEKDPDGDAYVNSAGDYFDPPLEWPVAKWQANVSKNVGFIPGAILDWAGAVNQSSYVIDGISVEARKSRLIGIRIGKQQQKNEIPFRVVSLTIEFSDETYKLRPLDQGFRIKEGTTLKDVLVADEDGNKQRPSAPVLLDGAGARLADPSPATAVFLEFDPPKTPEIDFSLLPLV